MKPSLVLALLALASHSAAQEPQALLDRIGTSHGPGVVLGDSDGKLAVELARKSELPVSVQSPADPAVAAARRPPRPPACSGRESSCRRAPGHGSTSPTT